MEDDTFVGQKLAGQLGYTIYSTSGNNHTVYQRRDFPGIFLTVVRKDQDVVAELSFVWDMLTVSTGWFGWPHPKFERLFEAKIINTFNVLVLVNARNNV